LVLYKYIRHFSIRDIEFEKTTTKKIKRQYD
jgi:long-chain acyl-CoA synthetase